MAPPWAPWAPGKAFLRRALYAAAPAVTTPLWPPEGGGGCANVGPLEGGSLVGRSHVIPGPASGSGRPRWPGPQSHGRPDTPGTPPSCTIRPVCLPQRGHMPGPCSLPGGPPRPGSGFSSDFCHRVGHAGSQLPPAPSGARGCGHRGPHCGQAAPGAAPGGPAGAPRGGHLLRVPGVLPADVLQPPPPGGGR